MPADHFAPSFESPLFRLRLTRYAPTPADEFGINPHVDTRVAIQLTKMLTRVLTRILTLVLTRTAHAKVV